MTAQELQVDGVELSNGSLIEFVNHMFKKFRGFSRGFNINGGFNKGWTGPWTSTELRPAKATRRRCPLIERRSSPTLSKPRCRLPGDMPKLQPGDESQRWAELVDLYHSNCMARATKQIQFHWIFGQRIRFDHATGSRPGHVSQNCGKRWTASHSFLWADLSWLPKVLAHQYQDVKESEVSFQNLFVLTNLWVEELMGDPSQNSSITV